MFSETKKSMPLSHPVVVTVVSIIESRRIEQTMVPGYDEM